MPKEIATMLYDGDCGFCTNFIEKWKRTTGQYVDYCPYQQALLRFPQVTEENCKQAVQLVLTDGSVLSGAHAVLKALDLAGRFSILHWFYDNLPLFDRVSELVYQLVAHHRMSISKLFYRSVKKCE